MTRKEINEYIKKYKTIVQAKNIEKFISTARLHIVRADTLCYAIKKKLNEQEV